MSNCLHIVSSVFFAFVCVVAAFLQHPLQLQTAWNCCFLTLTRQLGCLAIAVQKSQLMIWDGIMHQSYINT